MIKLRQLSKNHDKVSSFFHHSMYMQLEGCSDWHLFDTKEGVRSTDQRFNNSVTNFSVEFEELK